MGVVAVTREPCGARQAVFTPVNNQARVDAVVRRLGDAIELGLLADGEQLPGESDLAAQLGVSTVTLREALMALRQQGLVTTRRGRGGGVSSPFPKVPPRSGCGASSPAGAPRNSVTSATTGPPSRGLPPGSRPSEPSRGICSHCAGLLSS